MFTYEDGRMVRPDSLTYVFRKLATAAHQREPRAGSGRTDEGVSERLGHSRESTTSALYTVVVPAVARDAAEKIASVVPLPTLRE